MKSLLQSMAVVASVLLLLFAGLLVYSTVNGYTVWYLPKDGEVSVDGHPHSGYLHWNSRHHLLLLTRTDGKSRETYLVPLDLDRENVAIDCGAWSPLRYFPVPIGDVNPPCSAFTDLAEIKDAAQLSTLVRSNDSVEFTTVAGTKVRARW